MRSGSSSSCRTAQRSAAQRSTASNHVVWGPVPCERARLLLIRATQGRWAIVSSERANRIRPLAIGGVYTSFGIALGSRKQASLGHGNKTDGSPDGRMRTWPRSGLLVLMSDCAVLCRVGEGKLRCVAPSRGRPATPQAVTVPLFAFRRPRSPHGIEGGLCALCGGEELELWNHRSRRRQDERLCAQEHVYLS